jgi:hypothetical protein
VSYATVVDELMAEVARTPGLSEQQVSHGDEKVFALGMSPVVVVGINPSLEHRREAFGGAHLHVWTIALTVAARWQNDVDGPLVLRDAWQAVMDQLCIHSDLDDTTRDIEVTGANLEPIHFEIGNAKFASVALGVRCTEDVTVVEV